MTAAIPASRISVPVGAITASSSTRRVSALEIYRDFIKISSGEIHVTRYCCFAFDGSAKAPLYTGGAVRGLAVKLDFLLKHFKAF